MTTDELVMWLLREFWGGRITQDELEAALRCVARDTIQGDA